MRVLLLFAFAFASCAALRTAGRPLGRQQILSQRVPVLSLSEPEAEPAAAVPVPPAAPMDPRKAVEELGSLVKQVQELWTEGKTWSIEERASRRRALVSSYVAVFAPAVAFSGVQLSLSIGSFLLALLGLKISGRGYADLVSLSGALPPLQVAAAAPRTIALNIDPYAHPEPASPQAHHALHLPPGPARQTRRVMGRRGHRASLDRDLGAAPHRRGPRPQPRRHNSAAGQAARDEPRRRRAQREDREGAGRHDRLTGARSSARELCWTPCAVCAQHAAADLRLDLRLGARSLFLNFRFAFLYGVHTVLTV